MAHALDWNMVRDAELTELAQPHLVADITASVQPDAPVDLDAPFTLQIGERRFITTPSTLKDGSTYFTSFFSGRWKQTPDGRIFVDGDGDSFEHVLSYLRYKTKPLFWTRDAGFDTQKYNALQTTADYFGVTELNEWITDSKYLEVVTIKTRTELLKDVEVEPRGANTKVSYVLQPGLTKDYRCPLAWHEDNSTYCRNKDSDCRKYRLDHPTEIFWKEVDDTKRLVVYEEAVVDWTKLQ
jgi:hypothetical protein